MWGMGEVVEVRRMGEVVVGLQLLPPEVEEQVCTFLLLRLKS